MRVLIATVLVTTFGLGCASIQRSEAIKTERLLAAAGFQMKLANTPEKLGKVEAMTQRKLQPHQKDGKVVFVYADAEECKCIYVGSEEAQQRFQALAVKQRLSDQARETAEMNQDAAMEWNAWGPWGPWY